MRPICMVGGGLAGLSLGIYLRGEGVPVTVYDAGRYPRHRVCGEFICGVSEEVLQRLGVWPDLAGACVHEQTVWFQGGQRVAAYALPQRAWGISRYRLDALLIERFQDLGGVWRSGEKVGTEDKGEGWVLSCGRKTQESPWLGLKAHYEGLSLQSDLEIHLGQGAYLGLSRIEEGRVNACGLFRRQAGIKARAEGLLLAYLQSVGLAAVGERLAGARQVSGSALGVSAVQFAEVNQSSSQLFVGDRYSVIPPFTGNGMSMAFESAWLSGQAVLAYAKGQVEWSTMLGRCYGAYQQQFAQRLRWARRLHPWIWHPWGHVVLGQAARWRCLPFTQLFRLLH